MRLQPHVLLPLVAAFSLNVWFNWKELLLFCLVVAAHAATASSSDSPSYGPTPLPDGGRPSSSPGDSPLPGTRRTPSLAPLASGKVDSLLDAAVQAELMARQHVSETVGIPSSSLTRMAVAEAVSARLRPDPHMREEE